MATHKGIAQFKEGIVKEVVEYLWEFSQKNNWEIPQIVPHELEKTFACVQWGSKIIIYVLPGARIGYPIIEVDIMGVIEDFLYPSQISDLIVFLLNK